MSHGRFTAASASLRLRGVPGVGAPWLWGSGEQPPSPCSPGGAGLDSSGRGVQGAWAVKDAWSAGCAGCRRLGASCGCSCSPPSPGTGRESGSESHFPQKAPWRGDVPSVGQPQRDPSHGNAKFRCSCRNPWGASLPATRLPARCLCVRPLQAAWRCHSRGRRGTAGRSSGFPCQGVRVQLEVRL